MIEVNLSLTLTQQQRQAWQTIRPVLKSYLAKVFRLYRAATPEQKAVLRAHNPTLDAVLNMLGED